MTRRPASSPSLDLQARAARGHLSLVSTPPRWLQLRVTLREVVPPVWRRLVVPDTLTLARLHRILQVAMGWQDYHLHEFLIGGQRYGTPAPDWEDADEIIPDKRVTLRTSLGSNDRFLYTYDFGDNWEHDIVVEASLPGAPAGAAVQCTEGGNACPPEDVGGPFGYADFLEAMQDPAHEAHDDMRRWWGGDFDPYRLEIEPINRHLRRFIATTS